jgi:hypothetical protein
MKIEILKESLYGSYEKFLESQDSSLFYHSIKYKNFLEDFLGCQSRYLLAYDRDEIVAAFPLMIKEGVFGKVVNSLPYYGSNGGIISKSKLFSDQLMEEYNQFIAESDIVSAVMVENPLSGERLVPRHNMRDERIGQFTNIKCSENFEEEIFKRISGNRRNEIRRARKNEVEVFEENEQLDFIRRIHQNEMKEKNRKYKTDDFFNKIEKHFVAGKDYKVFIARRNQEPIAGLLMFYFNKVTEYFTPVVIANERIYQPMSLILYHAFLDAMSRGYEWFNWGGTWLSQEGVYNFKKQMGAQDFPYNYYIQINNPDILQKDSGEILSMYPDFYVFNFSAPVLTK